MTLEFAILGSGSRGNASAVRCDGTTILIDSGFSCVELERRLHRFGIAPDEVDALLVTHEHADHVSGVARFARAHDCAVWSSAGTAAAAELEVLQGLNLFSPHRDFSIGSLSIAPYPVPHDAREPTQFVISGSGWKLGILSDAGSVTPHMRTVLAGCDALLLEFNHCPEMLAAGPYPPALRERVGGNLGHLSNEQSAELLASLVHPGLQHIALTHLSAKNNSPELALAAASAALGEWAGRASVADQDAGLEWRTLQ